MNFLIFEHKCFGIIDICDALTQLGHSYEVVSTPLIHERVSPEFDKLFAEKIDSFDIVFTFNFSPVISNNCKSRNIPYIAYMYDCPQVALYSYTVINPCNYIFIFDKQQYLELKSAGIPTVYYLPLAANPARMRRTIELAISRGEDTRYAAEVGFVGSMYNEKHNLFDRLTGLPEYVEAYLKGIMEAQLKVYGYYFIEELLTPDILSALEASVPVEPNRYGVETKEYLYAYYFIARKLANMERVSLLGALSEVCDVKLYTPNPTPQLPKLNNLGAIDYYDTMPTVFHSSRINLNISLRSIRSGVPLRCLDICGAGGFLLSNYQADFYDILVPGEDMVMYESKEDMLAKCRYYLSHEAERAQIAANGLGRVTDYHTYVHRLNEILDIVMN